MKTFIPLFFLALLFIACGGSSNDNGCIMGTPEAIFSESLDGISNHNFKLVQNNSTEEFSFGGSPIVIYQTGCDQVSQEFQFSFADKTDTDKEAMLKMAEILTTWSKLGKKQELFGSWAQQIRYVCDEMQLGQSFTPAPNIEIAMDRVNQAEGEILTLTLNQKG